MITKASQILLSLNLCGDCRFKRSFYTEFSESAGASSDTGILCLSYKWSWDNGFFKERIFYYKCLDYDITLACDYFRKW